MGCSTSQEIKTEHENEDSPNNEPAPKTANGNILLAESQSDSNQALDKPNDVDKRTKKDHDVNSPQESLEVLVSKKDKPRTISLAKNNSIKRERFKSKELKQVTAWGKKSSATEQDFLEDLRLHRSTAANVTLYEKEYEAREVDETSRFIEGAESEDLTEPSLDDIVDESSNQASQPQPKEQEESFDASKIVDVEKFRAANVTEKKELSNINKNNNGEITGNSVDISLKPSSQEKNDLNRSPNDTRQTTNKKESFSGMYNDDDKHLIESIEKEFLIEDTFLPGQIIN